jgi:hypothetical protein
MKPLLDTVLLLAWIVMFLGLVYVVGHVRGVRLKARGGLEDGQYQAERDIRVRAAILVVGLLLGVAVYFVSRALGQGL